MKYTGIKFLSLVLAVALSAAAPLNAQQASAPKAAMNFDVAGSFKYVLANNTNGNSITQTITHNPGGAVEGRYRKNNLTGFGISFSYNPSTQNFAPSSGSCGYYCGQPNYSISSQDSKFDIEYVPSMEMGKMRPFALAGFGFYIGAGSTSLAIPVNTVVRPMFVFGGGSDFAITDRFGVRAQFRYNLYKAPNLVMNYPTTGQMVKAAEPMFGFYYRF